MPFILGTAGHIDHGKTTLVRALTGIDCDRLSEEKKRGITIELGFAWMDLPGGDRLGIVDVPGHERFVKNMVAGAAGIDFVMLVIAADEGVMPQTREHLEICSLLGIQEGFIVLTKTDMVDSDWLALVRDDVAAFVKGTFLEGGPILEVSATTGAGIAELKSHIIARTKSLPAQRRPDVFRLPVDRVFSLKGHGTIVTGTVISGRVREDSDAVLYPAGIPVHIRTLQRHGAEAAEAEPGERCAANLQNVEVGDVERGSTLADSGSLFPAVRWLVHVRALSGASHSLKRDTEVHFHHGTLEVPARVHFLETAELLPGGEALAEVRFDSPMVAVFGDHCVIRSGSPLRAVAGAVVVYPLPLELRRHDPQYQVKLDMLKSLSRKASETDAAGDAERVSMILCLQGVAGADFPLLKVLTGLSRKRLDKAVQTLSSGRRAVCFDRSAQGWISLENFEELERACLARAEKLHEMDSLKPGFARAALEAGWGEGLSPRLVQKVFDTLLTEGKLVSGGDVLCLAGHEVILGEAQEKIRQALLEACRAGHLTPPNLKDITAAAQAPVKDVSRVLSVLQRERALIKVNDSLYYTPEAMDEIVARVTGWFDNHDNLTLPDMKEVLGLSRKFTVPLLEYLDQVRVTVRIGDRRQLRFSGSR